MTRIRTARSGAGATGDDLFGHSRRLSASWWPGAHCQDICNENRDRKFKITGLVVRYVKLIIILIIVNVNVIQINEIWILYT